MASRRCYYSPNNAVRQQRETVLGLTQQQLADRGTKGGFAISAKSISRLEQGSGKYTRVTFTRILKAINVARADQELPAIGERELFPEGVLDSLRKQPGAQGSPTAPAAIRG